MKILLETDVDESLFSTENGNVEYTEDDVLAKKISGNIAEGRQRRGRYMK